MSPRNGSAVCRQPNRGIFHGIHTLRPPGSVCKCVQVCVSVCIGRGMPKISSLNLIHTNTHNGSALTTLQRSRPPRAVRVAPAAVRGSALPSTCCAGRRSRPTQVRCEPQPREGDLAQFRRVGSGGHQQRQGTVHLEDMLSVRTVSQQESLDFTFRRCILGFARPTGFCGQRKNSCGKRKASRRPGAGSARILAGSAKILAVSEIFFAGSATALCGK